MVSMLNGSARAEAALAPSSALVPMPVRNARLSILLLIS
jgi:hypothetical protein